MLTLENSFLVINTGLEQSIRVGNERIEIVSFRHDCRIKLNDDIFPQIVKSVVVHSSEFSGRDNSAIRLYNSAGGNHIRVVQVNVITSLGSHRKFNRAWELLIG